MKRELLKFLKCIECGSYKLDLEIKNEDNKIIEGNVICNKCNKNYRIKEGILIASNKVDSKKYKYWDDMYDKRNYKREIKWMENAFYDVRALKEYYAITYFFKENLIFNNSIEIGGGLGKYSLILKKLGYVKDVIMVDISFPSLLITKEIFKHFNIDCNLVLADAKNLPFKDKCFDLSFSGGLIEHFLSLRQEKIFKEHCRLANNVIIQVPTNSFAYWLRRILLTIVRFGWPFGFEKPLSKRRLKNLFLKNDFKIKDIYYHDFLTALLFVLSFRIKFLSKFVRKNFISKFFKSDLLIYGSA